MNLDVRTVHFAEYDSVRTTNAQNPDIRECFKGTDIVNTYCAIVGQIEYNGAINLYYRISDVIDEVSLKPMSL
jgi:hypothetical protein